MLILFNHKAGQKKVITIIKLCNKNTVIWQCAHTHKDIIDSPLLIDGSTLIFHFLNLESMTSHFKEPKK